MNPTPEKKPDKKPYQAPLLVRYGDLSRITNAVGSTGNMDGAGGKNSKTRA